MRDWCTLDQKNAKIAAMAAVLKQRLATPTSRTALTPELLRALGESPSAAAWASTPLASARARSHTPTQLFSTSRTRPTTTTAGAATRTATTSAAALDLDREFHRVQLRQLEEAMTISLQRREALHAAVVAIHDSSDRAQLARTIAADAVDHLRVDSSALIFLDDAAAASDSVTTRTLRWYDGCARSTARTIEIQIECGGYGGAISSRSAMVRAVRSGGELTEWSSTMTMMSARGSSGDGGDAADSVEPAVDFAWMSSSLRGRAAEEEEEEVAQLMIVAVRRLGGDGSGASSYDALPPIAALLACARFSRGSTQQSERAAHFTEDEKLSARSLAEAAAAVLSRFAAIEAAAAHAAGSADLRQPPSTRAASSTPSGSGSAPVESSSWQRTPVLDRQGDVSTTAASASASASASAALRGPPPATPPPPVWRRPVESVSSAFDGTPSTTTTPERARFDAAVEAAVAQQLTEAVGAARRDTMRACERDMRRATERIATLQHEREVQRHYPARHSRSRSHSHSHSHSRRRRREREREHGDDDGDEDDDGALVGGLNATVSARVDLASVLNLCSQPGVGPTPCLLSGIIERTLPSLVHADAATLLFVDAKTGSLWLAAPAAERENLPGGSSGGGGGLVSSSTHQHRVEKWRVSVGLGDPAILRGKRPDRKASAHPSGAWRGSVRIPAEAERLLLGAMAAQRLLHVEHMAADAAAAMQHQQANAAGAPHFLSGCVGSAIAVPLRAVPSGNTVGVVIVARRDVHRFGKSEKRALSKHVGALSKAVDAALRALLH